MLSTVTLLCFSLQVTSLLAVEPFVVSTGGGGSDLLIENVAHDIMESNQELQVDVSQQHPERNSGGKCEKEWKEKKVNLILGKDFKNEDGMEIKDRMRDHAEDGKKEKEAVETKGTEKKMKESTVERSEPDAKNAKPQGSQTSGWYWAAETLDVTTIPIVTRPPGLPLTSPPIGDLHLLHQYSAAEKVNLTLEFRVEGHHLILDLHPTRDLLGATYKEPVLGTIRDAKPPLECEFQGNIRGIHGSWVAVSLCGGIRGVIMGKALALSVEPTQNATTLNEPHRVYSAKLQQHSFGTSGVKKDDKKYSSSSNNISKERVDAILHRKRREAIHGHPSWTNKTTRYIELVLVADHSYYLAFQSKTAARCRAIVNIVNAVFRPLGLVVVLTHLEVWDTKDKIEVSEDSNKTIDNMRPYRQKLLASLPDVPNDNTQLLTTIDFEGSTIGKGLLNGMCSYKDSVGIVQDQKFSVIYVAQTMAHEIGHNLGLGHDEDEEDCQCDTNGCIMNSGISTRNSSHIMWSSCSKKNITSNLNAFLFDCLKNVPSQQFSGSICGNGIVEDGEQCDCGPQEFCKNPCCLADSCKLVGNASCASGACCDTQTCRPKLAWTVCRAVVDECDTAEYCSGDSEFCPPDIFKKDGTSCRQSEGHCYKGECGSHEGRCQQIWGKSASAGSPHCYTQFNLGGDSFGNCGFLDQHSKTLQPCSAQDALCGTLHCSTDADVKPKLDTVTYTAWRKDKHDCRRILSDDIPPSSWLVPDGAPCGSGQMCVNQKCVAIPRFNFAVLFGILLVLLLFSMCCMWDHLRWWWDKKGRSCMSPNFPCCVSCLDTCCCPFMTRIFRCCWYPLMFKIIKWIENIFPSCKLKKSSPKEVVSSSKGANEIIFKTKADEQTVVEIPTSAPHISNASSYSSHLLHNNVDNDHSAHQNSVKVTSKCASHETPLLNQVNSANIQIHSPEDMLHDCGDDVVLDKLSKLTQNLSILSGKENEVQNSSMDKDICESSSQQVLPPCTSSMKIVPVRKAPLPPLQRPAQDGNSRSSEPVMDSGVGLTISQQPEPTIPPRPDFSLPFSSGSATSPRQEPVVPPRPDPIEYSKPEPIVPVRPEYIIPVTSSRQEPVVPPRPAPIVYSQPKPLVPQRPECTVPPSLEPVLPPKPEFPHPPRQKPIIPPRP